MKRGREEGRKGVGWRKKKGKNLTPLEREGDYLSILENLINFSFQKDEHTNNKGIFVEVVTSEKMKGRKRREGGGKGKGEWNKGRNR